MKIPAKTVLALSMLGFLALPVLAQPPAAPKSLLAYTPKPVKLPPYGKNKPITAAADGSAPLSSGGQVAGK